MAFALAASSGTVASMRGYRLSPLVWGSGMALAAATAYARIASDDAWLTDTLAGAGLGTAVGVLVPLLLHAPETRSRVSVRAGRTLDVTISF
jgi:membrane-associated phospholipid phosphatase